MRAWTCAVLLLALVGCRSSHSGACSVCPQDTAVNLASCQAQGTALRCGSAALLTRYDSDCGPLDAGYTACVYEDCDGPLDCTKISVSQ